MTDGVGTGTWVWRSGLADSLDHSLDGVLRSPLVKVLEHLPHFRVAFGNAVKAHAVEFDGRDLCAGSDGSRSGAFR